MPIYEFKCSICKKTTEIVMSLGQFSVDDNDFMGKCKCGAGLWRKDQQINFAGCVTGVTPVTSVSRRYSNKQGGPKPVIDGKIRNDLKMPTQV